MKKRGEMNTEKIKDFCKKFPGATSHIYGHPSNILVYFVDDKRFAYFKTSEPEKWRLSIRVTPDRFIELTDIPGIKPAKYFARFHWVTIVTPCNLSTDYLNELIEWSYRKALGSLSKARQLVLLETEKNSSCSQ
ncbi:MAG: MmcQ/YjbR family DNA-binding protein [Arenimonas sp.]